MASKSGVQNLKPDERKALRHFGLIIREEREKKNWTLEDTEANGYPNWQHWQSIESGLKNIGFTTIMNICKTLKVQPKTLFKKLDLKV